MDTIRHLFRIGHGPSSSHTIAPRRAAERFYAENPTAYTLLKAMEVAGNEALDKGIDVERKGLGTPATRAGVIENLIYKGFVERDKKNLIATSKGKRLIEIVADNFKSAETTAEWEMVLSKIAKGKSSKNEFLKGIETH